MHQNLERALFMALAFAAAAMAVTMVHREFRPRVDHDLHPTFKPVFVADWARIPRSGISRNVGSAAQIQLVEFADLECPFCAKYEPILRAVEQRYGPAISRVFVHYPLPMHRFARAAAVAAECAQQQGRFEQMRAALYAKQDSFGLRPWLAYARDAGVVDLRSFQACDSENRLPERVKQGSALANELGLRGTPTIIVNGWQYTGGPPESVLTRAIDALLAGKGPTEDAFKR